MIFALLIAFQIKHFVADFPLQTPYMLRKFLPTWSFFVPLLAHSAVHALFTLGIALLVKPEIAVEVAILDLVVHFTMDRLKAGPKYLGRFRALTASEYGNATDEQKLGNKFFWWSLGVDQMVHHVTHYFIIYLLVR
jgi:hypothetical protein